MRKLLLLCVALVAGRVAAADEITVFAAASLREAFDDLGKQLEAKIPGAKVKINYAGSGGLADLPKAKRLVIGVREVPIGEYAMQILEKANAKLGKDFEDRVL